MMQAPKDIQVPQIVQVNKTVTVPEIATAPATIKVPDLPEVGLCHGQTTGTCLRIPHLQLRRQCCHRMLQNMFGLYHAVLTSAFVHAQVKVPAAEGPVLAIKAESPLTSVPLPSVRYAMACAAHAAL